VAIEPEEIFDPSTEPLTDKTPFQKLIRDAAARYNLDPPHPLRYRDRIQLRSQSRLPQKRTRPDAVDARTAELMGVKDSFDPGQNIDGGSHYLSDLLKKYKNDITLALAAYNAGPDSVDKYGRRVSAYLETMKIRPAHRENLRQN